MIRNLLTLSVFLVSLIVFPAMANAGDTYVRGYYKRDGTYVQPHYRTKPNRNPYDNFSTKGNVNPYTGQKGYRDPIDIYQEYKPRKIPSYEYESPLRESPYLPFMERKRLGIDNWDR